MSLEEPLLNIEQPQQAKILIVDDNPANLSVLTDYLEDNGFEIMAARDGKTGLEMAHLAQPDIIL